MIPFEQQVAEALRQGFRAMRLVRAGRQDDPARWSSDDLATDLAPHVAAAMQWITQETVHEGLCVECNGQMWLPPATEQKIFERALAVLRGDHA